MHSINLPFAYLLTYSPVQFFNSKTDRHGKTEIGVNVALGRCKDVPFFCSECWRSSLLNFKASKKWCISSVNVRLRHLVPEASLQHTRRSSVKVDFWFKLKISKCCVCGDSCVGCQSSGSTSLQLFGSLVPMVCVADLCWVCVGRWLGESSTSSRWTQVCQPCSRHVVLWRR